jgi:uncharacterized damage-inducible protein DinB
MANRRSDRWGGFARAAVVCAVVAAVMAGGARGAFADGAPAANSFRGEFLTQMQDAEDKLVDLAGAMPQSRYTWRPGREVRSVAEVYLHVAAGNYALPAFGGYKPPAGIDLTTLEKSSTDKTTILTALKRSFEYVHALVVQIPDADLDRPVTMFGTTKTTVRGMLLTLANHQHEHLGQSIAYARMNRVVPPWTLAEQARARAAKR